MKCWNTTGFKVEAGAGGKLYYFGAFEEKEVWNEEHAVHLEKSFMDQGIVCLNYDESAKVKFPTYDEYKSYKELEGLKKALSRYEQALADERQYVKDVNKNSGSEADKAFAKVADFEENVKLIKSWMKEAGAVITEKKADTIPKRKDWRRLNDTTPNTNKG